MKKPSKAIMEQAYQLAKATKKPVTPIYHKSGYNLHEGDCRHRGVLGRRRSYGLVKPDGTFIEPFGEDKGSYDHNGKFAWTKQATT